MRRLYNILFGTPTYYYDPLVRTTEEGLKMVTIYKHHPGLKPKAIFTFTGDTYERCLWVVRMEVKNLNGQLTKEVLLQGVRDIRHSHKMKSSES